MDKIWKTWCRICARDDVNDTHVDVFFKDQQGLPISDTINKCFPIEINQFNNWPHTICKQCYHLVKTIITFEQTTIKVQAMFEELFYSEKELDLVKIRLQYKLDDFLKKEEDKIFFPCSPQQEQPDSNPLDMLEQMIDVKDIQNDDKDILNTCEIKTEEIDPTDCCYENDKAESSDEYTSTDSEEILSEIQKKTNRRRKKSNDTETYTITCSECSKSFKFKGNYRRHMQNVHNIKIEDEEKTSFVCEECGKVCNNAPSLKYHKTTHSDERMFECSICKKQFKSKQSLKMHEDTHNDTNYVCVECGLQLNSKRTLNMHMLVHSDQKQHKCDYCGNEYKRAKALKNHLILHTGLKPYRCNFCDRTFANGSNCRTHKKKSHPVELAALEAAGLNSITTNMPKLKQLKDITADKSVLTHFNVPSHIEFGEKKPKKVAQIPEVLRSLGL